MKGKLLRRSVLFAAISAAALIVATPGWAECEPPPPPPCGEQPEAPSTAQGNHFSNWWGQLGGYNGSWFRGGYEEEPEPCPVPTESEFVPAPTRAGYCSVAGNTYPDGKAIPAGAFLDLEIRQGQVDPNYEGAVPAIYVQGLGITCDPPPAGFSFDGSTFVDPLGEANGTDGAIYPFYKRG